MNKHVMHKPCGNRACRKIVRVVGSTPEKIGFCSDECRTAAYSRTVVCGICHARFTTIHRGAKYCSDPCRKVADAQNDETRAQRLESAAPCHRCGSKLTTLLHAPYCSTRCLMRPDYVDSRA